jgi:mitochondrial fission protein ELM1
MTLVTLFDPSFPPLQFDVVVASVLSIGRKGSQRLEKITNWGPGVVIVDEAHHTAPDNTWDNVISRLGLKKAATAVCCAWSRSMWSSALPRPTPRLAMSAGSATRSSVTGAARLHRHATQVLLGLTCRRTTSPLAR